MTGTMKHGFSTLNRLLGKKSKDDIPAAPTVSNGNTNAQKTTVSLLSRSMTNLDTTSQYNKIVPLAAMNNAPFEQTFRITVCLPRDQLFVARVGAKTKLEQLLDITCTNKQLDRDKYEFRHPADNSQVFHNELTIGEVGLNEIRLVAKSDTDQNFNLDDLKKMRPGNRNSYAGQSTSSDQFQKGASNGMNGRLQSHHSRDSTAKTSSTVSPYSSTNSLNSVDSSNSRGNTGGGNQHQSSAPVAPMRKKRAAPRPPSQNSIPEHPPTIRKNFHVSSPNLATNYHQQQQQVPKVNGINGNHHDAVSNGSPPKKIPLEKTAETVNEMAIINGGEKLRPVSLGLPLASEAFSNGGSHSSGSTTDLTRTHSRTSSDASEFGRSDGPELIPRRKANGLLKKKKAAPAPPPRTITPTPPVPTPRTVTKIAEDVDVPETPLEVKEPIIPNGNVSKVMLNVASSPEPAVKEEKPSPVPVNGSVENVEPEIKQNGTPPVSISTVKTSSSPESPKKLKSVEPSSDEDDEHKINIYNLKSGACVEAEIVQDDGKHLTESEEKEAVQGLLINEVVNESLVNTGKIVVEEKIEIEAEKVQEVQVISKLEETVSTPVTENRLDSPLDWTYTLPAPPNFADSNNNIAKKIPINQTPTLTDTIPNNYVNFEDDEDNMTIRSATTLVSDVIIKPVIKERIPVIEDSILMPLDLNNSNSESSDFNSSSTLTSGSANGDSLKFDEDSPKPKKLIINSDIEDGYHINETKLQNTQNIIENLEKRREKYIENELELLTKVDDPPYEKHSEIITNTSTGYQSLNSITNGHSMDREETINMINQSISVEPISLPAIVRSVSEEKKTPELESPEIEFKKPREYVRRSSSSKPVAKVVQRSDSFHSTRYQNGDQNQNGVDVKISELSSRSSSYVSLLGAQKFEQRRNSFLNDLENSKNMYNRRSSSELSISDTPSLQSLEVMKSILNNSRKSSGNGDTLQIKKQEPIQEIVKEEEKKEEKPKEEKPKEEPIKEEPVKEEPKKWVYTGPPKINLGSWSERPKIQVCIKSDSDYRFSGQSQSTDVSLTSMDSVKEEIKTEITIKETKKEEVKEVKKEEEKLPILRSNIEVRKSIDHHVQSPEIVPKPVISHPIIARKPLSRPLSMNLNGNTTKFTPVVRGFQWMKEDNDEIKSTKINPVMVRPVSSFETKLNGLKTEEKVNGNVIPKTAPIVSEKPVFVREDNPIFSQVTLRRTGLKEKILSQAEPTEVAVNRTVVDCPKPFIKPVIPAKEEEIKPPAPPPAPAPLLNPLAQLSQNKTNNPRPIIRGVVKKQIPSPEVDPRNQLLDSIRNFNFNTLRKM